MIGVQGSHHSIPQGEVRRVIAAEELMVLVVMGDTNERRRRPAPSTAVLVAGMADYAGNLIIDLVREQYCRGDWYQQVDNEPVRLQEKVVDQPIAVV